MKKTAILLSLTVLVAGCGSSSEAPADKGSSEAAAPVVATATPLPAPTPTEPVVEQTLLGEWMPVGEKCAVSFMDGNGDGVTDDGSNMIVERTAISGYEWHCDLSPGIRGTRYSGTQICSAEGEESPPTSLSMELRADGKMVMIDDGSRRIMKRCS